MRYILEIFIKNIQICKAAFKLSVSSSERPDLAWVSILFSCSFFSSDWRRFQLRLGRRRPPSLQKYREVFSVLLTTDSCLAEHAPYSRLSHGEAHAGLSQFRFHSNVIKWIRSSVLVNIPNTNGKCRHHIFKNLSVLGFFPVVPWTFCDEFRLLLCLLFCYQTSH